MAQVSRPPSPRQAELLDRAYAYALEHGLADLSLRPLAAAIGSSPRVLLFLFGSKDGLIRALLARARQDEVAFLEELEASSDVAAMVRATWAWLVDERHRPVLTLWMEAYARSLTEPAGPWAGFAAQTVEDWLALLERAQPARRRRSQAGAVERALALAVLRGALLDLLATGDAQRTTRAVEAHLAQACSPGTTSPVS